MAIQNKKIKSEYKSEFNRLFIISITVFLFILFFQPFPLEKLDYNNRLLFVIGFGIITFVLSFLFFVVTPNIFPKWFEISKWENKPPFILSALFLMSLITAFAFYVRFVGMVSVDFYIIFKIILICLLPLIIMIILNKYESFYTIIHSLKAQNKEFLKKIREFEKMDIQKVIEIYSENRTDKLSVVCDHIVVIKSADNYIEIFYLKNNVLEKKLLRNTLKSVDAQLNDQPNFLRCHRTSVVNIDHVEKLSKNYGGYHLKMQFLEESVPVSRQYIIQVKAAIDSD